jgi:hypothetical protein
MSALSAENSIHQGVSFGGDMLDKIAGANGWLLEKLMETWNKFPKRV